MKFAAFIYLLILALINEACGQTQATKTYDYARGKSYSQITAYQDSVITANSRSITWELCACERAKHDSWEKDMNWAMTYEGAKSLKTVSRFSKLVLGREPGTKAGVDDRFPYWRTYSKCIEAVSVKYFGHNSARITNRKILTDYDLTCKGITNNESAKLNYSVYPAIAGWVQRGVMTK